MCTRNAHRKNEDQLYKWKNIKNYRGELDAGVGKFIKTSSIQMGSDRPSFSTASQEAMDYRGGQIDYNKVNNYRSNDVEPYNFFQSRSVPQLRMPCDSI